MKFLIWFIIFILFGAAYFFRKDPVAPKLVMIATILAILVMALGKYLSFI
jgi:hypothetical protein